mmetsp:Transcript_8105/g.17470  ORF Transcript_8105/g.17470 Transcript_8105/m.17470 type:complete len:134 (-) Transcript_8105:252-653(-)
MAERLAFVSVPEFISWDVHLMELFSSRSSLTISKALVSLSDVKSLSMPMLMLMLRGVLVIKRCVAPGRGIKAALHVPPVRIENASDVEAFHSSKNREQSARRVTSISFIIRYLFTSQAQYNILTYLCSLFYLL